MTEPQQGAEPEPDQYVDGDIAGAEPHQCAVPALEAGQAWQCPGCGRAWGQQVGPDVEIVSVGQLLHDLAEAFVEGGHAFTPGVPPRETQAALYRIGGQVERAAKVFAQLQVAVPRRG